MYFCDGDDSSHDFVETSSSCGGDQHHYHLYRHFDHDDDEIFHRMMASLNVS